MKSEIPEKFVGKINEFMILRDIRLAPGVIICPSFVKGSWGEAWAVFNDEAGGGEISEDDERIHVEILQKLKDKGLEYTVRQVNIVDKFTPLRCCVGDHFRATLDPSDIDYLKSVSYPVASPKTPQKPPEQTQA